MNKLNDNELISLWNESKNQVDNSRNEFFESKYLKLTCYIELKKAKIINTRMLENNKYISFVLKTIEESVIYSFVIFNMDEELPPEKSRIEKYCLFTCNNLDIIDNIIEYKMNHIVNILNLAIDTKFDSLFNTHFKTMKCKLDKKQLIDVLIKPSVPHSIPSISNIIEEIDEKIVIENKELPKVQVEKIFKNTQLIKTNNNVFDNQKSIILEKSKMNEIFNKRELSFPKEEIRIMD